MIYQGQVLKAVAAPFHRWVVLNDPASHHGDVLFVNLTTLTDTCADDICVLDSSDYSDLDRPTTVAYSRKMIGKAAALDAAVAKGMFKVLPDMPPTALQKMIEGAKKSPYLSHAERGLL